MRVDERNWLSRVEGILEADERAFDRIHPVRRFPMDIVAVQAMRQLSKVGAVLPFTDTEILDAVNAMLSRNPGL